MSGEDNILIYDVGPKRCAGDANHGIVSPTLKKRAQSIM
jgi:hypothetical protein